MYTDTIHWCIYLLLLLHAMPIDACLLTLYQAKLNASGHALVTASRGNFNRGIKCADGSGTRYTSSDMAADWTLLLTLTCADGVHVWLSFSIPLHAVMELLSEHNLRSRHSKTGSKHIIAHRSCIHTCS
jgi:hypothetical protein